MYLQYFNICCIDFVEAKKLRYSKKIGKINYFRVLQNYVVRVYTYVLIEVIMTIMFSRVSCRVLWRRFSEHHLSLWRRHSYSSRISLCEFRIQGAHLDADMGAVK